ncbi:P2Y purinoceptor 11 [Anguilla anguilla]|uniref:P2Y purinoceptor 11 n=1 Tax=Anguilla anguilla TaxID=7936 RepID=UPI0015AF4A26|nr:P2Y purinoceptor 11 [Anguilla anguilla]XP_035258626.1 P2Y purinoceptor 11 [Anguilla anguilla]
MPGPNNSFGEFQQRFLPPLFGLQFCLALAGNGAALWLMVTRERRRNWHTGLVFSCNLAASDLLYALTLPLLVLYYAGGKQWHFGEAACKAERFLFTCNLYSSLLFVTCISVNRYVGIVHPFFTRSHVRPKHATAVSLLVWAAVAAASSPVLRFAGEVKNATVECTSTHSHTDDRPHFAYSVCLAVFGCLLPFLATAASYAAIFRVVWRNANITQAEKRKVGLMVGAVLALYAVSFVPYHVLRNYHLYLKLHNKNILAVYKAYQVSKGLVTLNICLHPLLYMALFSSIRTVCCGGAEERGAQSPGGQRLCPT